MQFVWVGHQRKCKICNRTKNLPPIPCVLFVIITLINYLVFHQFLCDLHNTLHLREKGRHDINMYICTSFSVQIKKQQLFLLCLETFCRDCFFPHWNIKLFKFKLNLLMIYENQSMCRYSLNRIITLNPWNYRYLFYHRTYIISFIFYIYIHTVYNLFLICRLIAFV
jgi:hypothetical protein